MSLTWALKTGKKEEKLYWRNKLYALGEFWFGSLKQIAKFPLDEKLNAISNTEMFANIVCTTF